LLKKKKGSGISLWILLRDAVLLILSTKGLKDIKTSHGKIVLKDELLMRLNSFLSTGLIRNIYFTSFVIQW
jgi:flagellar FliL protein